MGLQLVLQLLDDKPAPEQKAVTESVQIEEPAAAPGMEEEEALAVAKEVSAPGEKQEADSEVPAEGGVGTDVKAEEESAAAAAPADEDKVE